MNRCFFAIAIALAVVLGNASSVRADEAGDLLARHKAFVGYVFGDGSVSSLVSDTLVTDARAGSSTRVHQASRGITNRFTIFDADGTARSSSGFTGNLYWKVANRNGFIIPEVGDDQKYDIASDLLFNEATPLMHAQAKGAQTVDGVACTVLHLTSAASDAIDVYVDPSSGAYKRAVIDPDGSNEDVIDILAYKEAAPGKKLIWKWTHAGENSRVHERSFAKLNVEVSDADLHPPVPSQHWTFGHSAPIPIKYVDTDFQRGIFINADVNGVPGRFLLDTGASAIVLTQKFAEKAHVRHVGSTTVYGIGYKAAHPNVDEVDTIDFGNAVLSKIRTESANFELGDFQHGTLADGVIGFDFFAGAIVDLNLDAQTITLSDPQTMSPDKSKGMNLVVDLSNGRPRVPMTVDNRIPVRALIDTGSESNILYARDLERFHGLRMVVIPEPGNAQSLSGTLYGVGGIEHDKCGTLDTVSLGPIIYQKAAACDTESLADRDIIVGVDFVKNFNIVFDYPQSLMILSPRATH